MNLYRDLVLALAMTVSIGQVQVMAKQVQATIKWIPDGQFPAGAIYKETDLAGLAGKKLPRPCYLVGKFMYLGLLHNEHTFSTYRVIPSQSSGGYARNNPGLKAAFGAALLRVRFFNNMPRTLKVGKAIAPNPRSPLTLVRVARSRDGHLLVETEYWGTP